MAVLTPETVQRFAAHLLTSYGAAEVERVLAQEADHNLPFAEWLKRQVYIRDFGGTKFRPWLWQEELAWALPGFKRAIILKARQLGMSWLFAAYALHSSFEPGSEILLLSQTEKDAKKLLAKVKFIARRLPAHTLPRVGINNQSTLEFPDIDSVIEALPSTEMAGRGSTARLVIADEHAFHQWADENSAAIDPAIEAGGQFISLSSANGIGNLFADQCMKAANKTGWVVPRHTGEGDLSFFEQFETARPPEGGWLAIFLPYDARPGRTPEWWLQKKETFTREWKIFQEYPRDPEEAFVQTGRPVFRKDPLEALKAFFREPLAPSRWPAEFAGWDPQELRVFAPPQAGHRYVSGADVAEGLEHGDYSDLSVVDVDAPGGPAEVLTFHGHLDPDEFGARIDTVARVYPGIYGVERNNHGHAVLLKLKQLRTPGVYRERPQYTKPGVEPQPGKRGWETNKVTKPLMIDDLAVVIREGSIRFSDALVLPELTFYQTDDDGSTSAPSGQWDDRVMSRAIMVQMLKRIPAQADDAEPDDVPFLSNFAGLR